MGVLRLYRRAHPTFTRDRRALVGSMRRLFQDVRMEVFRDGPRRREQWPREMKQVRDSAFDQPPLSIVQRLTSRRRRHDDAGRYSPRLCRLDCWTVRAEVDGILVGYAWPYDVDGDGRLAYIDGVAVRAAHQDRRVGTALIDAMTSWLRECGFRDITGLPTGDRMSQIFWHHGISACPTSDEWSGKETRLRSRFRGFDRRSSRRSAVGVVLCWVSALISLGQAQ